MRLGTSRLVHASHDGPQTKGHMHFTDIKTPRLQIKKGNKVQIIPIFLFQVGILLFVYTEMEKKGIWLIR